GMWLSQRGERRKRAESESRLHGAVFGYQEGATKVPGILDIVVGDGNGGSLAAIAKGARQASNNAVTSVSETKRAVGDLTQVVSTHVVSDNARWKEVSSSLTELVKGQTDATEAADDAAT